MSPSPKYARMSTRDQVDHVKTADVGTAEVPRIEQKAETPVVEQHDKQDAAETEFTDPEDVQKDDIPTVEQKVEHQAKQTADETRLANSEAEQAPITPDTTPDLSTPPKKCSTYSESYRIDKARFSRSSTGDIIYDGKVVCRYFSTQSGCRAGARCTFLHKQLGCVFFQQAKQGCIFEDSGECPFSHDPDVVVVAPDLSDCSTPGCDRSCMNIGSTCILCFNDNSRQRRDYVRGQQRDRRETFDRAPFSGQRSGPISQSYFRTTNPHQQYRHDTALPTRYTDFTPRPRDLNIYSTHGRNPDARSAGSPRLRSNPKFETH
jgi:hypothetical protein